MFILAIGGLHDTGKSFLADYLGKKLSIPSISYSVKARELSRNKKTDIFKQADDAAPKIVVDWLLQNCVDRIILDGVQNPDEIYFLRQYASTL